MIVWQNFETKALTPAPNGAIVTFFTPTNYVSGTVEVWRNGVRKYPAYDDGFTEAGGNAITMKIAPETGDTLTARYQTQ